MTCPIQAAFGASSVAISRAGHHWWRVFDACLMASRASLSRLFFRHPSIPPLLTWLASFPLHHLPSTREPLFEYTSRRRPKYFEYRGEEHVVRSTPHNFRQVRPAEVVPTANELGQGGKDFEQQLLCFYFVLAALLICSRI